VDDAGVSVVAPSPRTVDDDGSGRDDDDDDDLEGDDTDESRSWDD
jgi:hypothetical protein